MSQKPLFSVVIPTYNHGHLIGRCLDSVVSQTFTDWEAIVVNNFSQDNTIEVVESYNDPRIRLINNANDGIIAVSRNRGIAEAKGEWICFLDSDDWWTPNKLEACLPYLANYDMLYHNMQIFSQDGGLQNEKFIKCRTPRTPFLEDLLRLGNCCPNSSVVLRKSIIDKVGLISEEKELVAVEDFDYWLRVCQVTERLFDLGKPLGYYWIGDMSISFTDKWFARQDALYKKHIPNVASKKVVSHIMADQAYRVARQYDVQYNRPQDALKYYRTAIGSKTIYNKIKSLGFLTLAFIKVSIRKK